MSSVFFRRIATLCACVVLAAAALFACSSFTGSPSDSTQPDATASDAGDATDGSSVRADAATATDAAMQAAFCDDASWVCDTFDMPATTWPQPPWDTVSLSPTGATIALSDAASSSPPLAMKLTLDADAGGVSAKVQSSYAGTVMGYRCTFDIDVAQRGTQGLDVFSATIRTSDNASYYSAGLEMNGGDCNFTENAEGVSIGTLPTGKWTTVVIDVTFGKGTLVSFNGANQITPDAGSASGMLTTPGSSAIIQLGVGHSFNDSEAWLVYYDNVRCDVH